MENQIPQKATPSHKASCSSIELSLKIAQQVPYVNALMQIQNINFQYYQMANRQIELLKNTPPFVNAKDLIQPCIQQYIVSTLSELSKLAQSATETVRNLCDSVVHHDNLTQIISNIESIKKSITWNTPNIASLKYIPSEEQIQQRIDSYKLWGDWGWTVIPQANPNLFNTTPDSRAAANRKALAFFRTKKQMERFWNILKTKKVRNSDIDEAIADFNDRRYKSCAMILFSLIDSRLIRLQGNPIKNTQLIKATPRSQRYRYCGEKASNKIMKSYQATHRSNSCKFRFSRLSRENLFHALPVFCANGNDFIEQPKTINRNFVVHGMLHRRVRRMDCIQLFLLYYNFLSFEERLTRVDKKAIRQKDDKGRHTENGQEQHQKVCGVGAAGADGPREHESGAVRPLRGADPGPGRRKRERQAADRHRESPAPQAH